MPKMQPTFYYYDQFGTVCSAKTNVDDGTWIGGKPSGLLAQFNISEAELEMPLDTLKRIYPYNG
jgi:hypothetical protein